MKQPTFKLSDKQINTLVHIHYFVSHIEPSKWMKNDIEENFPEIFKGRRKTLIREAKRRKITRGAVINSKNIKHRSAGGGEDYKLSMDTSYKYYPQDDLLQYGNNEATIYYKGTWAEVVHEPVGSV